jgi:hypothetical protein
MLIRVYSCFFLFFPPRLPTYSRLCNGHAPLLIQKGCASAGQKVQLRLVGQYATPDDSSIAPGMWEKKKMFGKVSVALAKCLLHSQSDCRTLLPHSHALANASSGFFPCFSLLVCSSFPRFPTYSKSCNGHAPLLIQKGRARTGQKVQPRRVSKCPAPHPRVS